MWENMDQKNSEYGHISRSVSVDFLKWQYGVFIAYLLIYFVMICFLSVNLQIFEN